MFAWGEDESVLSETRRPMRLENCILDINAARAAPIQRKNPEFDWVATRDAGVIPPELFSMYERAGFSLSVA